MENKGSSAFNIHKEGLMPQEEMLEVGNKQKSLKIGIPSENHEVESRVPLTPEAVEILTAAPNMTLLRNYAKCFLTTYELKWF